MRERGEGMGLSAFSRTTRTNTDIYTATNKLFKYVKKGDGH